MREGLFLGAVMALVAVGAATLMSLLPPPLDRGPCLASHRVVHHVDASFQCLPTMDFDGNLALSCDTEPARDWNETVCDQWTYPDGKAEQGP